MSDSINMSNHNALKTIAIIEASKGVLALLVSLGLHVMGGKTLQHVAEKWMAHLHLNPASEIPNAINKALNNINDTNLMYVALGTLLYALIRLVEAYGLWCSYRWTEWFAFISGAIYLPFELYEFIHTRSELSAALLLVNLSVVLYLFRLLKKQHNHSKTI